MPPDHFCNSVNYMHLLIACIIAYFFLSAFKAMIALNFTLDDYYVVKESVTKLKISHSSRIYLWVKTFLDSCKLCSKLEKTYLSVSEYLGPEPWPQPDQTILGRTRREIVSVLEHYKFFWDELIYILAENHFWIVEAVLATKGRQM